MKKSKIRVSCFVLQGFGNDLLHTMVKNQNVEITSIYTRESIYDFNYYKCDRIEDIAEKNNIPIKYIPLQGEWDCQGSDLAIVSSFHRIFKQHHIDKFNFVINIHPSLLPDYKGATPFTWMILNNEKIVGVTAHFIDEGIDTGQVLFQKQLLNPYLNDNDLRKSLSFFSKELIEDIINSYPDYKPFEKGEVGSYQKARSEKDSIAEVADFKSIDSLISFIKAFTNYPMPKLKFGDRLFTIDFNNPKETIEIELEGRSFSLLGYWNK